MPASLGHPLSGLLWLVIIVCAASRGSPLLWEAVPAMVELSGAVTRLGVQGWPGFSHELVY
jgi:hypothetical protein